MWILAHFGFVSILMIVLPHSEFTCISDVDIDIDIDIDICEVVDNDRHSSSCLQIFSFVHSRWEARIFWLIISRWNGESWDRWVLIGAGGKSLSRLWTSSCHVGRNLNSPVGKYWHMAQPCNKESKSVFQHSCQYSYLLMNSFPLDPPQSILTQLHHSDPDEIEKYLHKDCLSPNTWPTCSVC